MLYAYDHHDLEPLSSQLLGALGDEQLMERIKLGDDAALATLHRRHRPLLRTIVGRMLSNDNDAEDLVEECQLEIWQHAVNYRADKGQALAWIVTLARRRAIDRLRRKSAYSRAQDRFRWECETHLGAAAHAGADEEAGQSDAAEAMLQLLAKLPPVQQRALHLAYYRGMTQREISKHTGWPLGTVKTRLELGLRKLRGAILAFGELHQPVSLENASGA